MPWHARLGNTLVASVLRARTGRAVHDLPPFKVVRTDALEALALDATGYGWPVQLVGRALAHPALRVVEAPAGFLPRAGGESKVSGQLGPSVRAGRAMLGEAAGTRRRGVLALMAKAPRPGHCKTRLAADLGTDAAAGFWAACLADSAGRLFAAGRAAGADVLAMTPSAADACAVRELTGLPCLVQHRPGLGHALMEVSELPAPFTIAVSADAPTLPAARLLDAVSALRGGADAVLGPGEDGGYYLVGLRRGVSPERRRRAFLAAPLGGDDVLERTRRALGRVVELASWPDVDTATELDRLAADLVRDPEAAPSVARWLAATRS
jgi:glycosyltransferase A (GT-A) superfamily protein (DUF2064 family)